jgi:hypothetical protein
VLVALIEPQDAALVKQRAIEGDTSRSLAPWGPLVTHANSNFRVLHTALATLLPPDYSELLQRALLPT